MTPEHRGSNENLPHAEVGWDPKGTKATCSMGLTDYDELQ